MISYFVFFFSRTPAQCSSYTLRKTKKHENESNFLQNIFDAKRVWWCVLLSIEMHLVCFGLTKMTNLQCSIHHLCRDHEAHREIVVRPHDCLMQYRLIQCTIKSPATVIFCEIVKKFVSNAMFTTAVSCAPRLTCNLRKVSPSCSPMSRQCQCSAFRDSASSTYSTMSRASECIHGEHSTVKMTIWAAPNHWSA